MVVVVHGLAASIRACEDSETFDLAGHNALAITSIIQSAFQEPFNLYTTPSSSSSSLTDPNNKMIRITFIIGAGKQGRQKYDDNASKAVLNGLQKCGYIEDRAASCIPECAGMYKSQHDTTKNLKTIVVFPKITTTTTSSSSTTTTTTASLQQQQKQHSSSSSSNSTLKDSSSDTSHIILPLLPLDSPEYKIAVSSVSTFHTIIQTKCPSWIQKKRCLSCIETLKTIINEIETKLVLGKSLTESEQLFYNSVTSIDTKENYIKEEMNKHVENGNITMLEKTILLQQNEERINELKQEKKSISKAMERKEKIEKIMIVSTSSMGRPLRYQSEIRKLQNELIPLLQFQEQSKGRLLTIGESQKIAKKLELEEQIVQLEESSRGWFEEEEEFTSRVQACRAYVQNALKPTKNNKQPKVVTPKSYSAAAAAAAASASSTSSTKWIVPQDMGTTNKNNGNGMYLKSKTKNGKGSLFSAVVIDSDSDSDEIEYKEKNEKDVQHSEDFKDPKKSKNSKTKTVVETIHDNKKEKGGSNNKGKGYDAMMTQNDSDEEDDDDNDDDNNNGEKQEHENIIENDDNNNTSPKSNKYNKNKKKKKKSNNNNNNNNNSNKSVAVNRDNDIALNEAYREVKRIEKKQLAKKQKEHSTEHPIVSIVKVTGTVIIELILAFVTWIATLLINKRKPTQQQKKFKQK